MPAAPATMKAAHILETGPVENIRIGELPTPVPGPGEALVRVRAVSLNPIDLYLRSGAVAMPLPTPYIPGCDLAGAVVDVGPDCPLTPGTRVWASNQGLLGRQGAAAEYAAVHHQWLHPTPDEVSDADAAALALTGITAHLGLFARGGLKPGEAVYVSGGSGGVGSVAIQMAKAAGARVATTAGSPDRVELCRELGADAAINYKTEDVPASIRAFAPGGIDLWYETQREPDLETNIPLLRMRGRMVLIAGRTAKPIFPLGAFYTRDCALHGFAMFNADAREQKPAADDINRWAAEKRLKAVIGARFPLEETREAQRLLEQNTLHFAGTLRGKVVIEIPG